MVSGLRRSKACSPARPQSPDAAHSGAETRFLAIGRASSGRHVFLAFTWRERDGAQLIRPISARYMHAKEVQHYERG